jgi:hypothetical protein
MVTKKSFAAKGWRKQKQADLFQVNQILTAIGIGKVSVEAFTALLAAHTRTHAMFRVFANAPGGSSGHLVSVGTPADLPFVRASFGRVSVSAFADGSSSTGGSSSTDRSSSVNGSKNLSKLEASRTNEGDSRDSDPEGVGTPDPEGVGALNAGDSCDSNPAL